MADITTSTYVLAVTDLERSRAYYRDVLGFTEELRVEGWSFLRRGACRLRLGDCPGIEPMSAHQDHSWFAYLHVADARALFDELRGRGVQPWHPLRDTPWRMREFGIVTPDGHRIVFGQPLGTAPGRAFVVHGGGCHCGRVRFEVDAPAHLSLATCNCSMCTKAGYRHLIVPADRFRLLSGQEALTTYAFNTRTARHLFCSVCGVKAYYVPRSHPDGISVNANCIDTDTVAGVTLREVDGRNWEAQYPQGRGSYES